MAIITISRASYSKGAEIAKEVAKKIGGNCISRESLLETSKEFDTPTMKLISSLDEVPSIFDRFRFGKHRYITYIQAVFLKNLVNDKTVYHGFAGHHFVKDISHALKICIFAKKEDRVKIVMERDNLSEKEASEFLDKLDVQRRDWGHYLYGIDIWDASQYDLTLSLDKVSEKDAVDMICSLANSEPLQITPESEKEILGLALASQVRTSLPYLGKGLEITAEDGVVVLRGIVSSDEDIDANVKAAEDVSGVVKVINEIECRPDAITSWGIQ